jgi:hypothetical protein
VQGRSGFLDVAEKLFPLPEEGEQGENDGFGKWLLFRVARSGTRKEGGFTEAQLREFEEEGDIKEEGDGRKYLGMVATETLASYGVDKVERTIDRKGTKQKKTGGFNFGDLADKFSSVLNSDDE